MIAGVCLIICAFAVVWNNMEESRQAANASHAILSSIRLPAVQEAVLSPSARPEPAYHLNPEMEMPSKIIDGHAYIGVLEIPKLNLSLPVMSEWSYPALKIAPCRYKGSAYTGDLIICAHNYEQHLGRLNELTHGDTIRFTDMDGNLFVYEAVHFEQLRKNQTVEMLSGEWDLTLFTCATGGQKRVTVRCVLVEEQPIVGGF